MTILISSHLLAEVEKVVSHVGIIFNGRMLFQGPLSGLHLFQKKGSRLFIKTSDNKAAYQLLLDHQPEIADEVLSVTFQNAGQVASINKSLTAHNLDVFLLHPKESDLEQLFIDLTTAQS
jgi:ABC-2 type transport system ATP-binding protein